MTKKELVKAAYMKWSEMPTNADYISRKGYNQAAGAYFLAYFLHSEGLIETESKADIVSWLGAEGIGFMNFSQHEQFLRKEGCPTKPKDITTELEA